MRVDHLKNRWVGWQRRFVCLIAIQALCSSRAAGFGGIGSDHMQLKNSFTQLSLAARPANEAAYRYRSSGGSHPLSEQVRSDSRQTAGGRRRQFWPARADRYDEKLYEETRRLAALWDKDGLLERVPENVSGRYYGRPGTHRTEATAAESSDGEERPIGKSPFDPCNHRGDRKIARPDRCRRMRRRTCRQVNAMGSESARCRPVQARPGSVFRRPPLPSRPPRETARAGR